MKMDTSSGVQSKTANAHSFSEPFSSMSAKRVAIVQSNYIPWKGYFDLIASVDEFILYDDVQYTRRDWRNRNVIKTPHGLQWLTVPVLNKGRYNQTIREARISDPSWTELHWKSIELNYARAAYFDFASTEVKSLYRDHQFECLSSMNRRFIEAICSILRIDTRISSSSDYRLTTGRSERLASLCEQAGANEYVTGPAAASYLQTEPFSQRNIRVSWFSYGAYPEYRQLWGQFVHEVSILDVLFNCGPDASKYIKGSGR